MKNVSTNERNLILARILVTRTKEVGDRFYDDRADDFGKADRDPNNLISKASNAAGLAAKMLGLKVEDASNILNTNIKTQEESEIGYIDRLTDLVIARVNQK